MLGMGAATPGPGRLDGPQRVEDRGSGEQSPPGEVTESINLLETFRKSKNAGI